MDKSFSAQFSKNGVAGSINYLFLFLVWPFLALIAAMINYNQKDSKRVVFCFLIYFGLNFILGTVYMDSTRYAAALESTALLPVSDFFKILGGLYSTNDSVDIYEPFVTFVVSRFSTNHRVLFGIFAAVFGFFYLKSINHLYNIYRNSPGRDALIHLIFFIIIVPVTMINGVRMWTAAWIFFYGAIHVILYRDKRYLLLALSSILVHWSFLSANAILIIYFVAGNRNIIYAPLAFASFLFPQLMVPVYSALSLFFGGSIQSRYEGYTSEGYYLEFQDIHETADWFVYLGNELVFYYLIIALIVMKLGHSRFNQTDKEKNLFSFLLLFLAFVNFGSAIPSFGNRFQIVFFLFATFYVCLNFINRKDKRISLLTWLGIFPMLLYSAVTFRVGAENINVWLFTPGFGLPWLAPGLSLAELFFY